MSYSFVPEPPIPGGWTRWAGTPATGPSVAEDMDVEVMTRDGDRSPSRPPHMVRWSWWPEGYMRDVVAYRTIAAVVLSEDDIRQPNVWENAPPAGGAARTWAERVISPSPMDRIAQLERELDAAKEDLVVAKDLLSQRTAFDRAMHRDASLWRDFRTFLQEAMAK